MNKKVSYILVCLLLSASLVFAGNDNTGTSAANFLKIGVSPRALAMGGAFVANANDFSSLYWNPAGIARVNSLEVGVSYTDWILDVKHSFVGIVYPLGSIGTVGVSFNSLSMDEMERTTPSEPHGTGAYFSAGDLALGVSYARQLTDRFVVGVQFKYVHESISFSSANTMAVDAGTQFTTGFYGMKIGMSISNFGGKLTMRGTDQMTKADIDEVIQGNPMKEARLETEAWTLPLIFRLGVSMDALSRENNRVTVNMDYNDPRDINPFGTMGVEYAWKKMVFLRGGLIYRPEKYDEKELIEKENIKLVYDLRFAFGAGVNLKLPGFGSTVRFDYSYTDLGLLSNTHSFSFTFGL